MSVKMENEENENGQVVFKDYITEEEFNREIPKQQQNKNEEILSFISSYWKN